MTQKDKDLLLKDLCARLPYGVKIDIPDLFVSTKNNIEVLDEIFCGDDGEFRCNDSGMLIKHVKPYLFPLSSMTEEQKKEYDSIIYHNIELHCERYYNVIDVDCYEELHDFYHKNHLDYRNLIGKGLAIDATDLNIY